MFDPVADRFHGGAIPTGSTPGPGVTPDPTLSMGNDVINTFDFPDAGTFSTLALAASPRYRASIDWRRTVQYSLSHFAQTITVGGNTFQGFNIVQVPTSGPNGIAWEFTRLAVALMRFVDRLYQESRIADSALLYLSELRKAQISAPFGSAPFRDGRGVVASALQDGDLLPPISQCLSTLFQCIPERVGLAATTWALFAHQNYNPLTGHRGKTTGVFRPSDGALFLKNSN